MKKKRFLPTLKQWLPRFEYIERTPAVEDVVLSGGDTYLLEPSQLAYLGERLLDIPHVRRFRFASKGLAVSHSRLIDPHDEWADTIIRIQHKARKLGKHVCIHTHFNNKDEITWITRRGAQKLYGAGVTIRNQSVLLNGVNNSFEEMIGLVRELSNINIEPVSLLYISYPFNSSNARSPICQHIPCKQPHQHHR